MRSVVGGMAALGTIALALISLALLGVPVPGAPQFPGPGGPVAFLVVGVVYAGLALLFGVAAFGVLMRRRWAWIGAFTANALTLVLTIMRPIAAGHVTPDVVPLLLLTFGGLVILLSRHGRTALRP